ncbi:B-cell receptor CD22 [Odontesthes bonariensis]|uniref:B-cell receptor CD22 n=1 Tax=Odontesthes bonariensis TaxID=219752 RepID=UPI003F5878D2
MKMSRHTVWWLIFLALIKYYPCASNPFVLEEKEITAMEGSCVEIKCIQLDDPYKLSNGFWFWMKDATWTQEDGFVAIIIDSTNESQRPVSPLYKNRVRSYDSSPTNGNHYSSQSKKLRSILICDLNKSDSGNYSFRFEGNSQADKWVTNPAVNLTIKENPCPITFKSPQVVTENETVTLTCSTLSSCPSCPNISILGQLPSTHLPQSDCVPQSHTVSTMETSKNTMYTFIASWKDDGAVFSCQMPDNKDTYLIRNISLTVNYAPKDILAKMSPRTVVERSSLSLTCSAKGKPDVTFSWFKKDQKDKAYTGAEWTITSIQDSQSGSYYCQAENEHGIQTSKMVEVSVLYKPEVDVTLNKGGHPIIEEGDWISLVCKVNRSKPQPTSFTWLKNGQQLSTGQKYDFKSITPEDDGVYTCEATNTVGSGESKPHDLMVHYRPRNTIVISGAHNNQVKVGSSLQFTCDTKAHPEPWFSWYLVKQSEPSHWTPIEKAQKYLYLGRVQREDEGCYKCNATNSVGSGNISVPECIQVLFPPTNVSLLMDPKVREGQFITITCTAESFPTSAFQLQGQTSTCCPPEWSLPSNDHNTVSFTFNATSAHADSYICIADNSEGRVQSEERKLVVEYSPKDVRVEARSVRDVKENDSFSLDCSAHAHPTVTSYTWMKMTDGNNELLTTSNQKSYSVKSASPSHSGLYSCTAQNKIGTGVSEQVDIKVKYAPKHTTIIKREEQQQPDGRSAVMLTCSSSCYPPAKYFWKNTTEGKQISEKQNFTVYSHQPGEYYCVAINEMGQSVSEPIKLFDSSIMTIVKYFFLFCLILILIFLISIFYRHRWKKSVQQRTMNTWPCHGFLTWRRGARRRNTMNETGFAEPFRSRDDLLPGQPFRPNAQRCQPRPDATSASNINSVYSTVDLPHRKEAPSAQKPARQQFGLTENDSLNYASLHFGNKQKKPEEDAVYSKVCKPNPCKKNEQERVPDYENIIDVHVAKVPNPYDYDTSETSDTSEDEVEVSYTQVNFKSKSEHRRANSSSTSSEDETHYSQVKI